MIVSSIRDVLGGGQGDPQRQLKMLQMFDEHFDHVLVHGDPALIGLDKTFGPVAKLASRMTYTGYVVEQPATLASATGLGKDEVLVSAGGGAVGLPLLEAALAARPMSQLSDRRWRILAGDNLAEAQFRRLQDLADQFGEFRVLVERARPEFPAMLAHCAVSVSQGGYNTVLEVLSQGARAVVVPFAGGGEIEQSMRAHLLHEKGWIQCVDESEMTPRTLAAAVDRAWQSPRPACQIRLDGARQTAQWVTARLAQRGLSGDGQ